MNYNKIAIYIVFIIILIYKIILSQSGGLLDDSDSGVFILLRNSYNELNNLSLVNWINNTSYSFRNLTDIFLRFLQIKIILFLSNDSKELLYSYKLIQYIGYINVLISILSLYVYYKILLKLNFSYSTILLGIVIYGTLISSNIYNRHILPYDMSLLLYSTSLFVLINNEKNNYLILMAGVFASIGLTNYFGFFTFYFILVGYITLNNIKSLRKILQSIILFTFPTIILTLFFEYLFRENGLSYFKILKQYSGSVNQGSFNETYIYIYLYSFFTESKIKFLLITLSSFFSFYLIFNKTNKKYNKSRILILLALLTYLIYSTNGYFFNGMVFFGRTVRVFYFFIVISLLITFDMLKLQRKTWLITSIIFVILIDFSFKILELNKISYPISVIKELGIVNTMNTNIKTNSNLNCFLNYTDKIEFYFNDIKPKLNKGEYLLLNCCFFEHHPDEFIETFSDIKVKENEYKKIYEKLHFMSHPIYTFEYCTNIGRAFFIDKKLKITLYKEINQTF